MSAAHVVALPPHDPCGNAGGGVPTGEGMTLVCVVVRTFTKVGLDPRGGPIWSAADSPGCSKAFPLCATHGVRACPCGGLR